MAANVAETSYVHSSSNDDRKYYWIVACNRGGCSDFDSERPAQASP